MIHIRPRLALALMVGTLLMALPYGCAPKVAVGPVQDSPEAAWQVFRQNYCVPPQAPGVLIKTSLYYTRVKPTKRTNRTVVTMWGDFGGPMRLDVAAGIGKLIAHIREDKDGLLVFYPMEKRAYAHTNPVLGATQLGMPFPFSLDVLAHVSVGDFSGLASAKYLEAKAEGENFVYTVADSPASTVTLDGTGRPIIIEGVVSTAYGESRTWHLGLSRYEGENGTPQPKMVTLSMGNGEKGVLRIKSREFKNTRWPDKATGLELPDNITYYRLDGATRPVE